MKKNNDLLKDRNPELMEEWDYSKNLDFDLYKLKANSSKKAWWICRINHKHKWESKISARAIGGHGCPYCSSRKVLKEESFAAKHPDMLKEWDWENNKDIDPWTLSENSAKKINWRCTVNSEHTWNVKINSRVYYGSGCPICTRLNKVHRIKGDKTLVMNFPDIAREWHPTKNLPLRLDKIKYGTQKKVWWQCSNDKNHIWQTSVKNRTRSTGGKCPYCSGVAVTNKNSLASLYPDIASEWHPLRNGKLKPDQVKKASGKKVWWRCSKDPSHEWEAIIKDRTRRKSGCPICNSESKYLQLISHHFNLPSTGSDYYKIFLLNIKNLQRMLKNSGFEGTKLEQPFLRMSYAATITALETYLSDAFYQSVMNSNERLNKLFRTDPEYSKQKYTIEDAITWAQTYKNRATKHIQKIVWHNIPRIAHLYKNVLSVKVPFDNESILKAISIRHDIIHRNGKNSSGRSVKLKSKDIETLITNILNFVSSIDKQLSQEEIKG